MAKVKIIGWDTGRNKLAMLELLKETLHLGEKDAKEMADAVGLGKKINLEFDDDEFAHELAIRLVATGAKVELESDKIKLEL
ncbi:MAG: hypothetical protein HKN25_04150 [Pyrinomonadaceae bacterium]|nr:hypothetical protein [Pyrinomonadaceae bacterium]